MLALSNGTIEKISMDFSQKKIGIWGLGLVGEAAVKFFSTSTAQIQVMDIKKLTPSQQLFLDSHRIHFVLQDQRSLSLFLEHNDYILPSPGIDLRPYDRYQNKWLSEVDIFGAFFKKPIIAITGTVGKTTITSLLSDMLRASGKRVITGGNIGIPLLSLINQQHEGDLAVIELSSFQLAICKTFAPDLAIWTNLYPNHLDWHGTIQDYTQAKTNIFRNQQHHQKQLLPILLHESTASQIIPTTAAFFSVSRADFLNHQSDKVFYTIDNHHIIRLDVHGAKPLIDLQSLPYISFFQNWLVVFAALDLLDVALKTTDISISQNNYFEHRLEHVATIAGVDFYNDSKATIAQATLAAVSAFEPPRSIILLLGGISKGVDRSTLIQQLPAHVKHIICFGKEAYQLHESCTKHMRSAHSFATLEQAYKLALKKACPGDIILLSPGGASFDLFSNYTERGRRFKELVLQHQSMSEHTRYDRTAKSNQP